ncbi:hypothetical protein MTZ49_15350 [Entomomonas sp. E2T0]|uniref:hypothetical protein n=1 Tax=Entomomonas sp. E2T0 TaxID=2930213 RepID=UPI002228409E|nr:hypothetical protein [Entomomonas sp. E2T0]UYZ83946.1 hypothetical protein MTZ49_15350 [Entomomonas sp. E2T0]
MSEPEFKVYGNKQILNNMIINVQSINYRFNANTPSYTGSRTQTLLYNDKLFSFTNDQVDRYKIYFSYDNQVAILEFDNIMARFNGSKGRINHLYVYEKDNSIYIEYYGFDTDIPKKIGVKSHMTIPLKDFFEENKISDPNDQLVYKEKLFEFYEPSIQKYKRDPLSKEVKAAFMEARFELKKDFKLLPEDIKKMNLPENELKELLK